MITASAPIAVAVPVSATALHAAFGPTSKDHHRRAVAVLTMAMGMRTHHQAGAKGRRQHARGTAATVAMDSTLPTLRAFFGGGACAATGGTAGTGSVGFSDFSGLVMLRG